MKKKTKFIPKLSDYGFSKELNNYNYASCTHLGTPATMAPEIMMNNPYNEKSDLWSVGVMMYQLYYREVPYEGNTEVEILQKIKSNYPYKQPKEKDLRDLINKLLVVNVQERLSWNDYFNHPFFVGNKNEEELPYESNNDINLNSINSCTYIGNNFSLSHFGKGIKTGSSNFGYSYSSDIFSDNYCFEGDIYGQKRKMSKSLRDIESSLEKKNNIKSKVQLFKIGGGINDNEYQFIVKSCIEAQDNISSLLSCANNDQNPISSAIIKDIKSQLKGEWFVFICNEEESNYDFFLPIYKERYIVFKYEQSIFQVYQIE
jgi:serine/threonine protein kinase